MIWYVTVQAPGGRGAKIPLKARSRSVKNAADVKLEMTSLSTGIFQGPLQDSLLPCLPAACTVMGIYEESGRIMDNSMNFSYMTRVCHEIMKSTQTQNRLTGNASFYDRLLEKSAEDMPEGCR